MMRDNQTPDTQSQRRLFINGILFFIVVLFVESGTRALWDPGEGRYGDLSRYIIDTGDWLVPHLNGAFYFEKPPLGYWLNAIAIKIFGVNAFAVRLTTLLSAFATAATAWFFARAANSERIANLTAFILMTCTGFAAYSQIPELDMLLTALFCLGMWSFYAGFELRIKPKLLLHLSGVFFSLGCLVKGPVSFVLGGAAIGLYILITRQWNRWRDLYLPTVAIVCAVVTLPWFIAISLKEKEFFDFFIVREHIQRFTSKIHSREGAWWYFLPVLIGGMYPWIMAVPAVVREAYDHLRQRLIRRDVLFCIIWSVVIFGFFSVSSSKRPPYILPIFPPLAYVIALAFEKAMARGGQWIKNFGLAYAVANLFLCALFLVAPQYIKDLGPEAAGAFKLPAYFAGITGLLAGFYALRKQARSIVLCVATCSGCFVLLAFESANKLDGMLSRRDMAQLIMAEYQEGDAILSFDASWDRNMQSLSFYTGKRVLVYGNPGELELGKKMDPDAAVNFPEYEDALNLLRGQRRVFVVMKKEKLPEIGRMIRLYGAPKLFDGKMILLSNKPWRNK